MLILTRKSGEAIRIGDDITISVVDIRGNQVRLGIDAPRTVTVHRQEVYDQIQEQNREAALVSLSDKEKIQSLWQKRKPAERPESGGRKGSGSGGQAKS